MKTLLLMIEVADELTDEAVRDLQSELDNPSDNNFKLTAYQLYSEEDLIPDIMKREEN